MADNDNPFPIPENETDRLRTLQSYDILDSPPEVDFDALVRLAAYTFDVPMATVGLLDSDRVWFKSRLGLDVPQLDRDVAFCAFTAMQAGSLLVVEDLLQDPRFSQNDLVVRSPNLRFYAGAPLLDPKGYILGTIAIVDTRPRTLDEKQRGILYDLSLLVMTALENRRRSLLLTEMVLTDYLTGITNRAQFDRALQSEMAHARRTGEPFSILCMDLDEFKDINDQYGHPVGDEVLCEVARRLKNLLRTEDTLSRIGGDEFGMVLREGASTTAQAMKQRIQEAMTAPIKLKNGKQINVGLSIGMATYSSDIDSPYTLLAQSDSDLYQVKHRSGKGR
ncbi:MAG: sensor domain-containing diguanylate cyclase [Gammaproteobacteria bacterium]